MIHDQCYTLANSCTMLIKAIELYWIGEALSCWSCSSSQNSAVRKILLNNAFGSPLETSAALPSSSPHPAQCGARARSHTLLTRLSVPHCSTVFLFLWALVSPFFLFSLCTVLYQCCQTALARREGEELLDLGASEGVCAGLQQTVCGLVKLFYGNHHADCYNDVRSSNTFYICRFECILLVQVRQHVVCSVYLDGVLTWFKWSVHSFNLARAIATSKNLQSPFIHSIFFILK